MNRPFLVDLDITGRQVELEAWVEFSSAVDDDAKDGLVEAMSTFAKLGAAGALSGAGLDPGQAGAILARRGFARREGHCTFQDVRIAPASICVLLNMLHWVHLEVKPVSKVRISWLAIGQLADPLAVQFPEQWPRPSFRLNIGGLLGNIDVNIEFDKPQSQESADSVVKAMSIWLLSSHRGAYADNDFDPSKSAIYLGPDVMEVSPDRIIWFIEVMRCNGSALYGLINLLEWVHQKIAPIRYVEIGP